MRLPKIQIPEILEEEKTPLVLQLVGIIEQISASNLLQAEEIQQLRDEIARLKGQKPKPNIQPSKLEKDPKKKETPSSGKRPGSRKVSGSTRSELGRRCRDTFTSLKKTCRKLNVSFWNYLLDRLSNANNIPPLHEIIAQYANPP